MTNISQRQLGPRRRTHRDPVVIRSFDDIDEYWEEISQRRRYSIPHSDGTFFSDGSGYSDGPIADLRYEAAERLKEVVERLRNIDLSMLSSGSATRQNSDFLPYAAEIQETIRTSESGISVLLSEEIPSRDTLMALRDDFARIAGTFISRGLGLCDTFLESGAAEAGREFGKAVGKYGGIALVLYLTGIDFQGVAATVAYLVAKLN